MAQEKRDYYEVLGVDKSADGDAIKRAYRQLAKKYHPDMNPGDKTAEEKFKEASEAYEVLSDSEKRARYDQFGFAGVDPNFNAGQGGGFGGFSGFGGFGGFDDILENFFGGGSQRRNSNAPVNGEDIHMRLVLSFEEAAFGCKKSVTYQRVESCSECSGSGCAAGTSAETCPVCGGRGRIQQQQRTAFGTFSTTKACDRCQGTGKIIKTPCSRCKGAGQVRASKTLDISIPAGIDDGQTVSVRGQGSAGRRGGAPGDLFITISMRPHPIFERRGTSIYCDIPVRIVDAALGAKIEIPTLETPYSFSLPEGTQTGTSFSMKGKGIPNINGGGRGELVFTVHVEVPTNLNEKQKSLLREFAETCGDAQFKNNKSFFDRLKDKKGKK
ncbi:MAG: molecular chaperone DnaJ [Clostridia bacterium]|nr:molecular chaperone DnaJ [Clostridia bacterium]